MLQVIHGQPTTNTFFSVVVVHVISSDFKNHLVLPLPLTKLDLLGSGDDVVERDPAALPGKRIAVQQQTMKPTWLPKEWEMGNRKIALCCCSYVEQVIKSTMKRVDNNSSVDLLLRVLSTLKFNTALQKEMEEKRGIKKINDYPETRCGLHPHMWAKDILEKKWDKLCEDERRNQKVLLLEMTSFKETTKVTLITLKLALESLFFFALEFLQNDRWTSPPSVVFTLESQQQYWEHLALALTFFVVYSSVNWKQSLEQQQSMTSAFATLAAALDPFTERLSGWQKIFLASVGTQSKWWHLLINKSG